ncbi:CPBP family intramembrane metalloprotease [Flavobacteriaceae bacterium]|nr:CPBP family intramembrane metalloprotease [Flavobacteriaceae bacterium]MDB4113061.1 CPBP family intramembrane metalloprotease [Flavobacteriaceae bacterium]MDB4186185.1 CPBP family intramembrane metalloprotease [Flavobacteriaceae bacterium]
MKKIHNHNGWLRILLLILPYIIIVGIFQYVGALISGVDLSNPEFENTSLQELSLSFSSFIGTFLVIGLFMQFVDKEKFIDLGFKTKGKLKEFIVGIVAGLIVMGLGYYLLSSMGQLSFQSINFDMQEILISFLLFTIVAIVEETLLRGYVLRNLMYSFNKYIALIWSSILFSLMHGFNPIIDTFALIELFLAGILLGQSYIHTKNLWFPIALHFSWNFFQTHFGFNVSGQDTYSLIEFSIVENNLWNGGDFGFEGSWLSIISSIIMIILVERYFKKTAIKNSHNT